MSDDDLQQHFRRKDRMARRSASDAARSRNLFDAVRHGDEARARRAAGLPPLDDPDGAASPAAAAAGNDPSGAMARAALDDRLRAALAKIEEVRRDPGLAPADRQVLETMWRIIETDTRIELLGHHPDAGTPEIDERIARLREHRDWLTRS